MRLLFYSGERFISSPTGECGRIGGKGCMHSWYMSSVFHDRTYASDEYGEAG